MRKAPLLLLVVSLVACNKKREHWNQIAEQANPVILELRKPVGVMLSPSSAPADVVAACLPAAKTARRLAAIDFGDRTTGSNATLSMAEALDGFTFELNTRCDDPSSDAVHASRCAKYCTERFGELADSIDRVRKLADEAGSKIEALR